MSDLEIITENDLRARVSHSQLADWDRCRFKWDILYNKGWTPKEKPVPLELGTVVHILLQEYYNAVIADEPFKLSAHINQLLATGNNMVVVSRAAKLVRKYVEDYAPFVDENWEFLEVERKLEFDLETPNRGYKYKLVGRIDLIARSKSSGKIWNWDHKTIGHGKFLTPLEAMFDMQQSTYALLLRHLGVDIFGIIFNQLNTYEYKNYEGTGVDKLFRREETYRSEKELESLLDELGQAVEDLVDNQHNLRRSLKRDCKQCVLNDPCLLTLKGMDLETLLEANFERKEPVIRETKQESSESDFTL